MVDPDTSQELTAANFDIRDMSQMFTAVRSVNVRGKEWPTEVALLGLNSDGTHVWSSKIFPALSWPQQILDLSKIDLRDAPPAADVAVECFERITRATGDWIHAEHPERTKKLLDTLLNENNSGFMSDETVIPVDVAWGPDGEMAAERVRGYLEVSKPIKNPLLEVYRLARAWDAGYPG